MRQRKLNIELIRIFSMMLILLWHISSHLLPLLPSGVNHVGAPLNYINLFITFHVDLFVIITGYFGIHHRGRSLIKIILLCLFYACLLNIIPLLRGNGINWKDFLLFSNSPWWFMKVYLLLLLIAPILERYMSICSHKEFYAMLAIAAFVSVYMGWFMHISPYDNHGYDIFNFILLYIIGHWLRLEDRITMKLKADYKIPLAIFLLCCVVRYKVQPISGLNWLDYSSPLNIIMAICVFCMFLKIRISQKLSRIILFFSSSAISVYLVTDYPDMRLLLARVLGQGMVAFPTTPGQLVWILAFILICFTICSIVDKLRIYLVDALTRRKG